LSLLVKSKLLPLAEKADILIDLQEDEELNAYLRFENNEKWLQLGFRNRV